MKKILSLLSIVTFCSLMLVSCNKEYTITVQSNNDAWGTVTGGGTYANGSTATLTAVPASGYYFNTWNDGNTDNPRVITVSGNATYIATFSDNPGGGGTGDPQSLTGTIDANRTLPDLGLPIDYIVESWVSLEGNACLTIEPGVTIAFATVGGEILVGENAGLKMVGTPDKHIVLRGPSTSTGVGSWTGVTYTSVRTDNQMAYVDFINGGHEDAVVNINGGKVAMDNCTIDGSAANGVLAGGSRDCFYSFSNNTIRRCQQYPIQLGEMMLVNQIGTGNVFESNTNNYVNVNYLYVEEDQEVTFSNISIPYYLSDGLFVPNNAKFIVNAGATILMAMNSTMYIAEQGYFQINGTADNPVIIRGLEDEPAYWLGISFRSDRSNHGGNYIRNARIEGCGGSSDLPALNLEYDFDINLENVAFGSTTWGIGLTVPSEWKDDTETYDLQWDELNMSATGLTFQCDLGEVFDYGTQTVYDASNLPTSH